MAMTQAVGMVTARYGNSCRADPKTLVGLGYELPGLGRKRTHTRSTSMSNSTYARSVSLMSEVAAVVNPGHLIREQRHSLGWSQQELAELSGVTQADLSRIENGRLDARWSTIQRIMTVLSDPSNRLRRSLANGGRRTPAPAKSDGPRWRSSGPVLSVGQIEK
jgi:DNA-binding XRE family transcriptional regulator